MMIEKSYFALDALNCAEALFDPCQGLAPRSVDGVQPRAALLCRRRLQIVGAARCLTSNLYHMFPLMLVDCLSLLVWHCTRNRVSLSSLQRSSVLWTLKAVERVAAKARKRIQGTGCASSCPRGVRHRRETRAQQLSLWVWAQFK